MGKRQSVMASEIDNGIPDDILAEIFLRLPGRQVVKSCVLVCKTWNRVANTQTLWKDKCVRDHNFPKEMIRLLSGEDFKVLYFKNPYCRNLIRNPDASSKLVHWKVTHSGGNGWVTETVPIGSDPVEDYAHPENSRPSRRIGCWATSYHTCRKGQLIDLVKEGCSKAVLDELRPDIVVSEWAAARFDCGIMYKLVAKLLGEKSKNGKSTNEPDYDNPLDQCEIEFKKEPGREWYPANYIFSGYPPGVRFIEYMHGGKDTYFWAGHYGAKMTLSTAKFNMSHCSGSLQGEEL